MVGVVRRFLFPFAREHVFGGIEGFFHPLVGWVRMGPDPRVASCAIVRRHWQCEDGPGDGVREVFSRGNGMGCLTHAAEKICSESVTQPTEFSESWSKSGSRDPIAGIGKALISYNFRVEY